MKTRYVYDIETFPNCFTNAVKEIGTDNRWFFEISDWVDDRIAMYKFLTALQHNKSQMVGFNNVNFDYPIIHKFMNEQCGAYALWEKCKAIIDSPHGDWSHIIADWNVLIPQIDLFKIHHFDNKARSTSLKLLEFNMRRPNIRDLPFSPNTVLTQEQVVVLRDYNWEDIGATEGFYFESLEAIEFREELGEHTINYNDTKIGKQHFIKKLEDHQPGICHYRDAAGKRHTRQTIHDRIKLNEVVFPYVTFKHPEFHRVHQWLLSQEVWDDTGMFKDVSATINDFRFDFGRGGIHGSLTDTIVVADLDMMILDLDVASYYPNLAIVNKLFPAHLGDLFCTIYGDMYQQRKQHAKGSAINKMLKLALNGVYGDTGNHYSPFFDMKYLLSITINGQLLLCMLAEYIMQIPGLTLIQINTDGLTVKMPRNAVSQLKIITDWWQEFTQLELEEVEYTRMWVRDCNNYVAEYTDGKLKRKGAYEHIPPGERNPTGWNQNLSALVIPKAAEAFLVRSIPIRSFIYHHSDMMDFMLRTKVKRSDQLMLDDQPMQRITRYLVTLTGGSLEKLSPPPTGYISGQWKRANGLTDTLYDAVMMEIDDVFMEGGDTTGRPWDERINTKNKSKYGTRHTGIDVGWLVTPFNSIDGEIDRTIINFEYYIQEANKLVEELK